jgi:hypothetical protein
MICADATFPTPSVSKAGIGPVLRMLPVYRKVFLLFLLPLLDEGAGSFSKPARASLIAAYKLVVLIARSVAKSSREGASGSEGEVKWAAAAGEHSSISGLGRERGRRLSQDDRSHHYKTQHSARPTAREAKRMQSLRLLVWRGLERDGEFRMCCLWG